MKSDVHGAGRQGGPNHIINTSLLILISLNYRLQDRMFVLERFMSRCLLLRKDLVTRPLKNLY